MKMVIPVPKHYDMLSSIHAWIFPDIQPVPEITSNHCFSRMLTTNEVVHVPTKVEQIEPGENLVIQFPDGLSSRSELEIKIQNILGLSIHTKKALTIIHNETYLQYLVPSLRGIKPYLADSLFEALMKSIIQQQISYRVANMLTQRMILGLTKPVTFEGVNYYQFPKPKNVLEISVEKLRTFGLGKKSEYIIELSSLIVSEELVLDALRDASYEEITEVLKPIRGIGTWTIDAFCIAGLGKFSVFPYGDIGVRNLLGSLYGSESFKKKQVIEKSESWGSYGPMVLYLLMCAEVLGLIKKPPSENA